MTRTGALFSFVRWGFPETMKRAPDTRHEYRPGYLVKLKKADGRPVTLILEVKGFETEQDRAKEVAARRWVRDTVSHS